MYTDGLLTLHYGKHPATLAAEVGAWYTGDRHVDVTLACDDGSVVKAHRVVLAAASPLLASLLRNPALDHVVHLSGVRKTQLTHLLEFLYNGEALIPVSVLLFFFFSLLRTNLSSEETWDIHIYIYMCINKRNSYPTVDGAHAAQGIVRASSDKVGAVRA